MSDGVDPREFLRRIMQITPEDAEDVREASPEPDTDDDPPLPATKHDRRNHGQQGPSADYGDES